MSGCDFFILSRNSTPVSPSIFWSLIVEAINRGQVYRYFSKPMDPEEIRDTVISAYQFYQASKDTRATYENILFENEQLEFQLRQRLLS